MFTKAPEIAKYAEAIIATFPDQFEHLEECRIAYLFTDEEIKMQGREKAGYVQAPTAQGKNREIYEWTLKEVFGFVDEGYDAQVPPDFIMVISEEAWREYSPVRKVMLIFHELCHIVQRIDRNECPMYNEEDGRPIYACYGHDREEFDIVAQLFGTETGHGSFARAVMGGKVDPRIEEVLKLVESGTAPPLPKRVPPPRFRCSKCEIIAQGKLEQGWVIVSPICMACGGKVKAIKGRG